MNTLEPHKGLAKTQFNFAREQLFADRMQAQKEAIYARMHEQQDFMTVYDENGNLLMFRHFDPNNPYDRALRELDFQKALDEVNTQLEDDPDNTSLWFDKAYALGLMGNSEQSLQLYNDILRVEPNNAAALNNAGCDLSALGRKDEAMEHYQKSARAESNNIHATLNIANMHLYNDDMDAYFNQLLKTYTMTPRDLCSELYLVEFKERIGAETVSDLKAQRAAYNDAQSNVLQHTFH